MFSTSTITFLVLISQQPNTTNAIDGQVVCAIAFCTSKVCPEFDITGGGRRRGFVERERGCKNMFAPSNLKWHSSKNPFSDEGQYSRCDILHSWPRDTFSASQFLFSIVAKATLLCSKQIKSKCKIETFGVDFLPKFKSGDCCVIYLLPRLSGCWFEVVVMEM